MYYSQNLTKLTFPIITITRIMRHDHVQPKGRSYYQEN